LVGRGMAGLEDAAIDAAAQVLDEGTEQAWIGLTDGEVSIDEYVGLAHGMGSPSSVQIGVAAGASASGSSTPPLRLREYGCCGSTSTVRASPASTTRPRCMMIRRSEM